MSLKSQFAVAAILLLALVLLAGLGRYLNPPVVTSTALDHRVPMEAVEDWMLQSLPGVGPVTAAKIRRSYAAAETIKWPKRAATIADQVIRMK